MPDSYATVLAHHFAVTGHEQEPDWATFLYPVCAAGIWERVRPFVRFRTAADDPETFRGVDPAVLDELPLSSGERLLLQATLHLYNQRYPSPASSDLAAAPDERHYQAVLATLAGYRIRVQQGSSDAER